MNKMLDLFQTATCPQQREGTRFSAWGTTYCSESRYKEWERLKRLYIYYFKQNQHVVESGFPSHSLVLHTTE